MRTVVQSASAPWSTRVSFLGAGHTEKTGRYRPTVVKAVRFLISRQDNRGIIGGDSDGWPHLNHAVAGLALAEAFGMARVKTTGEAAQKAVTASTAILQRTSSGWAATDKHSPDTITTAWFVLQLKSAIVAGLHATGVGFQGAIALLDKITRPGGAASLTPGGTPTPQAAAAALVARQLMGWKRTEPLLLGSAALLEKSLPAWDEDLQSTDLQYWCFGTMGMFQMGGQSWKAWNATVRDLLVNNQTAAQNHPALAGWWEPPSKDTARYGKAYSTAMCALCLEVYYRYLPLYR